MNAPYLKQLAFPVQGGKGPECNGMLLMDYFAAHAPTEIPSWFQHPDEFPVPKPMSPRDAVASLANAELLSEADKGLICASVDDAMILLSDRLAPYAGAAEKAVEESWKAIENARRANEGARYFAWRWHYALTMIRTRTNP